jgi:hypothetical protein
MLCQQPAAAIEARLKGGRDQSSSEGRVTDAEGRMGERCSEMRMGEMLEL